jgi:localization factor PodJL
MAYGSHRRRRDREADIRDVLEDAARDAGLSVSEFIEAAQAEHDEAQARRRPATRSLRLVTESERPLDALERRIAGRGQDDASEDRIAGILNRAFDEIRASEERTAQLIETVAGLKSAANNDRRAQRSVADVVSSDDRRFAAPQPQAAPGSPFGSLVERIQATASRQEVEAALAILERKLSLAAPRSNADQLVLQSMAAEIASIRAVVMAEGANVPLGAIETPLASLTERIVRLTAREEIEPVPQPIVPPAPKRAAPPPPPSTGGLAALEQRLDEVTLTTASMVAGIQDELVRLGKHGLRRDDAGVDQSFDRLDGRIRQLEAASEEPLGQIRDELRRLQATARTQAPDPLIGAGLSALEQKLDRIAGRISEPLRMVHNAVTQLTRQRQQPSLDDQKLDQLFSELSALKRGMANQSVNAGMRGLAQALVSISERIDGIAHRMQQENQPDGERDPKRKSIEEEIEEIKSLLKEAAAPCDDSRVLDAIGQLERKIAALENSPQALMERLDRLQARLDQPQPAQGGGAPASGSTDLLLRNLAARLETMSMASAPDDGALQRLQQEIRTLTTKIDSIPAPAPVVAPPASGGQVEHALADLLRQFDGLKADVGDTAARAAAQAVREFQPPPLPAAPPPATAHLESAISQLRQAQAASEERTSRTLEALHDTLHRVVDRLATLNEAPAQSRQPAPAPVSAPIAAPMAAPPARPGVEPPLDARRAAQMAAAPAAPAVPAPMEPARRAPPAASDDALLPADILEPRTAAGPAPSARAVEPPAPGDTFAATLANLRSAQARGAAREEPVQARSAVASAFAAAKEAMSNLRAGRADPPAAAAPADAAPPAAPVSAAASPPGGLDLPLEPGSGRPRPLAAARPQAPEQAMSAPAPIPAATPQPSGDPKADFLAAARRAAQAAAQQQAAASDAVKDRRGVRAMLAIGKTAPAAPESAPAPAAASPQPTGGGFRAKHAALLGTAALVVAVGAGYTFLGGGKTADAPPPAPPPRTSSITVPAAPVQPQQTASAPQRPVQAEAPRQILPPPVAVEPPRQAEAAPVVDPVPRIAQTPRDERITVGAVPVPDRVPRGYVPPVDRNDPIFRFEGLRDAPKLREAALRGDPSAFFEIGQRFADGRGATRDPKAAALWFERAAEHGFAPAHYRLGTMHREGRGVERNAAAALKHFQAAAEAGNARAMHNTAVLLAEGVKGSPDYAAAGEWFRKAAEFGVRDSQYNLAILHARGLGVGQDLAAAYAWFAAAAVQGDEDAAKKRDEVGSRLTPERLQQVRAAAQQWRAKTPLAEANEGTAPAGGWDAEARQAPAAAPKTGGKRI